MNYKEQDREKLISMLALAAQLNPAEAIAVEIMERIDLDHKVHINRALIATGLIWLVILTVALAVG